MSKTQNITISNISNQSSKIFIYNATSDKNEEHHHHHSKKLTESNKTSIEIQFSTPECHIRIENNSFNEKKPVSSSAGEMLKKEASITDSLSSFNIDEDVLMEGTDGKFYLGTIINAESEDYLVRFDDNTEKWSNYCKLKKLSASPTKNGVDLSLCVICKVPKEFDVVEICDKCSRGYHRQCIKEHNVPSRWDCSRCSFDVISISDSEELESLSLSTTAEEFIQKPVKFPYDLNSLKWDPAHRTNKENVYCYCGLNGSWKEKMLQCCRCRQWFHDNCIKIWNGGYMLHGDTFFIFCCSVCNEGNEFIRRLQISWRDIIHLIFYDLTITRSQKYHSISKDVVPFILQNVDKLFLPPEILKYLTKEVIEKKIIQLVRKLDIFKSINANKKKILYGLRKKSPPLHNYLQKVTIPKSATTSEPFSDDLMRKMKIKFVESIDMNGGKANCNGNENNHTALIENDKKPSLSTDMEVCDSSDETSSKSTLDLIIPPPDNFKGFNNPFHVNYKSDVKLISEKLNGLIKRNGNSMASKFPEVRIVRTIKRRLSAKDLLLGPNQEFKRRKITKRRKSADVEVISEIIQPINFPLPPNFIRSSSSSSMTTSSSNIMAPTKNDIPKKSIQSKSNNESAKDEIKINLNETVLNSPVKNNSINLYFGAMHRIENGEKFTILAKRVTFDRKEQYLLDWDGKEKLKDHDVF